MQLLKTKSIDIAIRQISVFEIIAVKLKIALLLVAGTLLFGCSQGEEQVWTDTQGNPIPLSMWKGKWVIINYWASWCDGCIEEIPELNRFYQHNQDKNVLLYGVNYDHLTAQETQQAASKAGIQFPVIIDDPNPVMQLGEITVVPTTFIINPAGKLVKTITGINTEKSLHDTLKTLQNAKTN
ncbi:TlpA disulfide reductase family protein [Aquicella lusitana]|uniref:Peroxiredoxin n=1 Tax=Aquicella lusitana TaxID=254246 RepID=A0A370GJF4_9COXI|nr:TlpA disulfide reductase family protein [Aquicella lusitana]RDI43359.1 peroxiredoxin [Aquicella lusitana]VVC73509.1 Thiol-disulfide oxidoreductase ResA [Aquicella lusitana]